MYLQSVSLNETVGHVHFSRPQTKKVPPPRPPPPNLTKIRSKSVYNIDEHFEEVSLIDLSPPNSPKSFVAQRNRKFGGSVSSSFSSSTSSLASSKRSFEYEVVNLDPWKTQNVSNSTFYNREAGAQSFIPMPTIIRSHTTKTGLDTSHRNVTVSSKNHVQQRNSTLCDTPPMPNVPPPSPPKEIYEEVIPCAIASASYTPSDTNSQLKQLELEVGSQIITHKSQRFFTNKLPPESFTLFTVQFFTYP